MVINNYSLLGFVPQSPAFLVAVDQLAQASVGISHKPDSFLLVEENALHVTSLVLLRPFLNTGWMTQSPLTRREGNFVPVRTFPQVFADGTIFMMPETPSEIGTAPSPKTSKHSLEELLELRSRARGLAQARNFSEAFAIYEIILGEMELFSTRRQASTLRGMASVCRRLNDLTRAEDLFRQSLSLREHPEALTGLAKTLKDMGQISEANQMGTRAQVVTEEWQRHTAELKELRERAETFQGEQKWEECSRAWETVLEKEALYFQDNTSRWLEETAKTHEELQHWPRAEELFRKALSQAKNKNERGRLLYYLSLLLQKLGRHEEAIPLLEQAILLSPAREGHLRMVMGRSSAALGRSGESSLLVDQTGDLKNRATQAMQEKDFAAAAYFYQQLLDLESTTNYTSPITACNLGIALRRDGQLEKAEKAFRLSLKWRGHPRSWCELGITLRMRKRFAEAMDAFKQAAKLEKEKVARTFNEMGWTYLELGNFQEALVAAERAVTLEGQHPFSGTLHLIALALRHLAHYEESLIAIRRAKQIEGEKEAVTFWIEEALILRKMKRYKEALEAIEAAKKLDAPEEFADTWSEQGLIFYAMGQHAKALLAFDRAIELDDGERDISLSHRAEVLYDMGRYPEALIDIERAEAEERRPVDLIRKTLILNKLGRFQSALYLIKSVTAKSRNPRAWKAQGLILFSMFRYEEALEAFLHGLSLTAAPNKEDYQNIIDTLTKLGRLEEIEALQKKIALLP